MKNASEVCEALEKLSDLEAALYEFEPCGGPLHIITDDGNVRDSDLVFCFRWLHENPSASAVVEAVSFKILKLLSLMTEPQRVVWWTEAADPRRWTAVAQTIVAVRDGRVVESVDEPHFDWEREVVSPDGTVLWKGRPRPSLGTLPGVKP